MAALPAAAPEPTAVATHGGVGVVPAAASALLVGAAVWAGMAGLQKWRTGRGGGGEQAAALKPPELATPGALATPVRAPTRGCFLVGEPACRACALVV